MRLIYFHTYGRNPSNGPNKKIFAQAFQLFSLGFNFELVIIGGLNDNYPPNDFIKCLTLPQNPFFRFRSITRFFRQYIAKKYIMKTLQHSEPGTILYLRYPLPLFLHPENIPIRRQCKLIIECNAIEINEEKGSNAYLSYFRELLLGKEFRKRCDAIVGVTEEITRYQVIRSGDPKKPHITIGNGIDTNSIPVRTLPEYSSSNIEILCVANVFFWHGYDRLIRGLAQYEFPAKIKIYIVGYGKELIILKKLVEHFNLKDQVIFEGFMTGDALNAFFNSCHIAVGSLGIHRKGLTQTSELKAREYCARGIPYVIACGDPDFPDDFPWILRVPADESPIDIEEVIKFAQRVYTDPDHPQKMRAYAVEHLDWLVKMKKLKEFLETLVDE